MIIRPLVVFAFMTIVFPPPGALPWAKAAPTAVRLAWTQLPDLPNSIGLKGMYGGVSNDQVLLAGGSNFPVPPTAGGRKTFHRALYRRAVAAEAGAVWELLADGLPHGVGEGASATSPHGVVGIGGHDGMGPVAMVFLLRWNPAARVVERKNLPELPEPLTNAAAALLGRWLYVAGGEGRAGATANFWRLDLDRAVADPSTARWETLPAWPGRPRFGGVLAPITTVDGEALLWAGGMQGPARSQADYLRDAYVFLPANATWRAVATLPRGVVLGAAVALDAHRVLVLGGSDGHDFERMKELGDRYRIPQDVLLYDPHGNRWSTAGAMPLGLVGAAVTPVASGWLVAGGEYSPGLRTPAVHCMTASDMIGAGETSRKGGER